MYAACDLNCEIFVFQSLKILNFWQWTWGTEWQGVGGEGGHHAAEEVAAAAVVGVGGVEVHDAHVASSYIINASICFRKIQTCLS